MLCCGYVYIEQEEKAYYISIGDRRHQELKTYQGRDTEHEGFKMTCRYGVNACVELAYAQKLSEIRGSQRSTEQNTIAMVLGVHAADCWTRTDLESGYMLVFRCRAFSWKISLLLNKYWRKIMRMIPMWTPKIVLQKKETV